LLQKWAGSSVYTESYVGSCLVYPERIHSANVLVKSHAISGLDWFSLANVLGQQELMVVT
jgi:hypothetical protein